MSMISVCTYSAQGWKPQQLTVEVEDAVINGHAGHLLEGAVIKQLYSLYCSLNILFNKCL